MRGGDEESIVMEKLLLMLELKSKIIEQNMNGKDEI